MYFFPFFLVIIEAIELLTGKFDKNLIYRQILANTSDPDPEILDPMIGIISITVPTVGGKKNIMILESTRFAGTS